MSVLSLIGGGLSVLGTALGGLFKTKELKAQALTTGITGAFDLMRQADATDAQIATAVATGITASEQSEGVLARNWRPIVMLALAAMVGAWCWGYTPPNINNPMPPFIAECFELLKFGLGFYIPSRSVEKIAKMFFTPKLIQSITSQLVK